MKNPRTLLVLAVMGAFLCAAGALLVGRQRTGPERLPRMYPAPTFSLTSEQGKTVTNADYLGKVWVADFVFVSCGGICPIMTSAMAGVAAKLRSEPDVRFVSFDVDPDRDSVAVLAAHAKSLGADPARWSFLRGDTATIRALSKDGFKLGIEDGKPGDLEPILHSNRFALVDRKGFIRGYYEGTNLDEVRKLEADARSLVSEWRWLATVNATLNATSTALLLLGFFLVRTRRLEAHRRAMTSAFVCSAAFLTCYVVYHVLVGSVRFQGEGSVRTVYLTILATHIVLAAAVAPLAITVFVLARKRRFETHRRVARFTLPIWLYVSVTGVVIYAMLYHYPVAPR